jgi:tetratricopeptide (TPR) repeat protein
MKYLVLTVFVAGSVAGSVAFFKQARSSTSTPTSSQRSASEVASNVSAVPPLAARPIKAAVPVDSPPSGAAPAVQPDPAAKMELSAVNQAVDLLLSNQTPYSQRSSVWKQLREQGGMDPAIRELEQRLASNPGNAQCAAVLGHAYLQKCGTISDVRDKGIFAMQADKLFDTALELDSQNWEARFTKAMALSYWPASMGKGDEVIQHFLTLIQQQETQPAQPQFAQPYLWLGDQYQKIGHPDEAHDVWARGAALYPTDHQLADRLASAP